MKARLFIGKAERFTLLYHVCLFLTSVHSLKNLCRYIAGDVHSYADLGSLCATSLYGRPPVCGRKLTRLLQPASVGPGYHSIYGKHF
jgi:hypothetical protein